MGNQDNWHTPKQLKIERAGDPRPLRRGALKKGERRKGRKARWDEVEAAFKRWSWYKDWYARRHDGDSQWLKEGMEDAKKKYEKLQDKFLEDFPKPEGV